MNKCGFTLVEVLTVVVIIGILASIALPKYARTVERARATEAMASIKAINDSIYAYYSERETCPTSFKKLVVNLSGMANDGTSVTSKYFTFSLDASVNVPGTSCPGAKATRRSGYSYAIWNPFAPVAGKAQSLRCSATEEKSIAVCESLELYEGSAS